MPPIGLLSKLIEYGALLLVLLAIAFGGWTVRGWKEEADAAKQKARDSELVVALQKRDENTAAAVEKKLSGLRANERLIEREIPKIIDRVVYRNECLDDDGLRLIESVRSGRTAVQATVSASGVPGVAGAQGKDGR